MRKPLTWRSPKMEAKMSQWIPKTSAQKITDKKQPSVTPTTQGEWPLGVSVGMIKAAKPIKAIGEKPKRSEQSGWR